MRARAVLVPLTVAGVVASGAVPLVHAATDTNEVRVEARVAGGAAPTRKRPRPVALDVTMRWATTDDGAERKTLQRLVMLFPRGAVYNGGKTPSCSAERLENDGPQACPKGSIVGRGTVRADADLVSTTATITVVNGGARRVWFFTHMENPAIVDAAVPGKIERLRGRWSYRLTVDIPGILQIVAATPIYVRDMTVRVGKGDWITVTRQPTAVSATTTLAPPHG